MKVTTPVDLQAKPFLNVLEHGTVGSSNGTSSLNPVNFIHVFGCDCRKGECLVPKILVWTGEKMDFYVYSLVSVSAVFRR